MARRLQDRPGSSRMHVSQTGSNQTANFIRGVDSVAWPLTSSVGPTVVKLSDSIADMVVLKLCLTLAQGYDINAAGSGSHYSQSAMRTAGLDEHCSAQSGMPLS